MQILSLLEDNIKIRCINSSDQRSSTTLEIHSKSKQTSEVLLICHRPGTTTVLSCTGCTLHSAQGVNLHEKARSKPAGQFGHVDPGLLGSFGGRPAGPRGTAAVCRA